MNAKTDILLYTKQKSHHGVDFFPCRMYIMRSSQFNFIWRIRMEDNNSLHFNENSQAQQPYNTSYDNTSYMQPDMQSTVQQPYQQGQQGM